ncbi:MAG TPA: glycine cleavage system protein GcvH [Firmicutes bacterium]|nr:glycine cleavage system protein GcvH [Bacillota bacterium]
MNIPSNLQYSKSHEWIKEDGGLVEIGLTDHAQDQLGDLVFVNLPQVGDPVTAGEVFADVESVKAVSDVYSPVTGTVAQVNEALLDAPETINESPYEAWLIRVEAVTGREDLMDAAAYEAHVEKELEEADA